MKQEISEIMQCLALAVTLGWPVWASGALLIWAEMKNKKETRNNNINANVSMSK